MKRDELVERVEEKIVMEEEVLEELEGLEDMLERVIRDAYNSGLLAEGEYEKVRRMIEEKRRVWYDIKRRVEELVREVDRL
jgi:Na+/phosphate symporter